MAGVWSRAVLLLAVVLLSAHSVYCRPTTRPSLSIPSFFPKFNFSSFRNTQFVPRVPKIESQQERIASAQIIGVLGTIGGLLARYVPTAIDCIRYFNNNDDLQDRSTVQADPDAIINELDDIWRRQVLHGGGTIHASAQSSQIWSNVRNCVGDIISNVPSGPRPGELQQMRQNWAIISSVLDESLNQQPLPPTESTTFGNNPQIYIPQTNQQAKMQHSQDWSVFCNVMDTVMNEPDSTAAPNTQTAAVSQETQQQTQQAAAQTSVFRSLGNFARRHWPNARECLNDLLNRNENDQGDPDAIVNEFERIWKRQTQMNVQSTEVASSQIRQFWPAIRDCVDRFVTGNTPPDRTGVQSLLNLLPFDQSCNDALYIMTFTGGNTNAGTTNFPFIELTVDGETSSVLLPGLERFNFINEKGDLFKIDLLDFGFATDCIQKRDVDGIAVVEGGTDGWLIDSIVTFLRAEDDETFTPLSSDIDAFQWIDGNGGPFQDRFDLTIV